MKKLLLLILIPFCFIIGGQNWKWLNPLPQGRTINQLIAIDSLTAYAITDNGVFIRTIDGGINWDITVTPYTNNILHSLYFADNMTGWLAGENGLILFTNNGGISFTKQITNTNQNLYSITSNGSKLFCAGSNAALLISSDNGSNWIKKEIQTSESFAFVNFISSSKGFITGSNGTILRTTDGGDTWNNTNNLSDNIITSAAFINDNNGWACGQNGVILHSTNGGSSWESVQSPSNKWFTSVSFINNTTGIITAKDGVYLRTTDSGSTWNLFMHDSTLSFNTISFLNNGTGWVAGSNGFIVKSKDAGFSWDFQSSGDRINYNNIKFLDPNYGYILGNKGFVLRTTDGGITWVNKSINTHYNLYDLSYYYWYNYQVILAASDSSTVFRSADFGDTWDTLNMRSVLNTRLTSIGATPLGVMVVGESGVLGIVDVRHSYKFNLVKSSSRATMTSVAFFAQSYGMISGEGGAFFYLTLGDSQLEPPSFGYSQIQTNFTYSDLYQVNFFRGLGFAVGKYGILLRTVRFVNFQTGYEWTKSIVNMSNPKGVHFSDSLHGYICGNGGELLKSTNSGVSWSSVQTNLSSSISRMWWLSESKGFIIGPNGLFIETSNGGGSTGHQVQDVKEVNPDEYYLSQNYPNPFNPTTSITYNLPEGNFVSLKVFDILGREAATLKNEYQPKGKYTVNFNASSLSSGIYFYVLRINDHTESRKMILLK